MCRSFLPRIGTSRTLYWELLDLITLSTTRGGNRREWWSNTYLYIADQCDHLPFFSFSLLWRVFLALWTCSRYRWDEWVPEQRLLKLNEAGFQKRRQLLEQQTKKNRPSSATSPAPTGKGKEKGGKKGESSKKRGRESGVDNVSGNLG